MDNIPFNSILQALLSQNNELIQQAQKAYIALLNQIPEQLALIHFQALLATNNEQIRSLILVLLGNYFTLLKQYDKKISPEASKRIQSSLLLLFQNENFSQYHFGIISDIIFKSAKYFKNFWPELPEQLILLLNQQNPLISSSSSCILADCIKNGLINRDQYFDILYLRVQNVLTSPAEPIKVVIPSTIRLFYSLASSPKPNVSFTQILNLIPNYLVMFQEDPRFINDLLFFAYSNQKLFADSLQIYFQTIINIINSPNFSSGIKNTSLFILDILINRFPLFFQPLAITLFDFYVSKIPEKETHESIISSIGKLSKIFGKNDKYALHVYDFFDKNAPNPCAYIVIGVSYKGIKDHFTFDESSQLLLAHFTKGFFSENSFVRLKAFQYFESMLKTFYDYDDAFCPEEIMNILLTVMSNENQPQIIFYELKILSILLDCYVQLFVQILPDIFKILDHFIEVCNEQDYIRIILECYKSIAAMFGPDVREYSQHCVFKFSQYINNPLESDDLFYYCIELLPFFNELFPVDIFNQLLSNVFAFLFSVVFDNNGNENENYKLASYSKSSIIIFFLRCLLRKLIQSPPILEKITMISFNVALEGPELEIIHNEEDISLYDYYSIFSSPEGNCMIAICPDETYKIQNSLIILYNILSSNNQLIPKLFDNLYQLVIKMLQTDYYNGMLSAIYDIEKLIIPFAQNVQQIIFIFRYHIFNSQWTAPILKDFTKLLIVIIKTVGTKWNDNVEIIDIIFKYSVFILHLIEILDETEKKRAHDTGNITYDDWSIKTVKDKCALTFRELFRYFPLFSVKGFPVIFKLVNDYQKKHEYDKTISTIVFTDFIHFCPQENLEFFNSTVEFFKQGLSSNFISFQLDSICSLAIIIKPEFCNVDTMKIYVDMFMNFLQNSNNDRDTISRISFALLQIFQKYSSVFNVFTLFPTFFQVFNENLFQIPKYYYEYYAQSLIFFISNFKNSIPPQVMEKIQTVIQKLIQKHLDAPLIEALKSVLVTLNI